MSMMRELKPASRTRIPGATAYGTDQPFGRGNDTHSGDPGCPITAATRTRGCTHQDPQSPTSPQALHRLGPGRMRLTTEPAGWLPGACAKNALHAAVEHVALSG